MGIGYRIKQKVKYHFAASDFEKRVAEINRNSEVIQVNGQSFQVKGCHLNFNVTKHGFLTERIDDFLFLIRKKGSFSIKDSFLIFSHNSLSLRVLTAEELFIIKEIYFDTCYAFDSGTSYNVIDIGMNVGFASLYFAQNTYVQKVWSFEPFKKTFQDAEFNFKLNEMISEKIVRNNFGLGNANKSVQVGFNETLKGKNSILSNGAELPTEKIEIRDASAEITSIVDRIPDQSFFIKMDCEGAEFEIFETFASQQIPKNIVGFVIEWHEKNPKPIVKILLQNGFKIQSRGTGIIGILTAIR